MALVRLSDNNDWELEDDDQDIRGWDVVDADGEIVGMVDDLIINTDTEMVELILLDDGTEVAAEDIEIGDELVYLEGVVELEEVETTPVVGVYEETRVRRRS